MNKISAASVLERLWALLDVDSDSKLARAIGVNRQTLGSWRSRDSVPYELCVSLALERGASLDWLIAGNGEMFKSNQTGQVMAETPREEAVLTMFRALSEDEQRDIQKAAQDKKRLREVEQRLEEMTELLREKRTA